MIFSKQKNKQQAHVGHFIQNCQDSKMYLSAGRSQERENYFTKVKLEVHASIS